MKHVAMDYEDLGEAAQQIIHENDEADAAELIEMVVDWARERGWLSPTEALAVQQPRRVAGPVYMDSDALAKLLGLERGWQAAGWASDKGLARHRISGRGMFLHAEVQAAINREVAPFGQG